MKRIVAAVFIALALAGIVATTADPGFYHDIRPQAGAVNPDIYHDIQPGPDLYHDI